MKRDLLSNALLVKTCFLAIKISSTSESRLHQRPSSNQSHKAEPSPLQKGSQRTKPWPQPRARQAHTPPQAQLFPCPEPGFLDQGFQPECWIPQTGLCWATAARLSPSSRQELRPRGSVLCREGAARPSRSRSPAHAGRSTVAPSPLLQGGAFSRVSCAPPKDAGRQHPKASGPLWGFRGNSC